MSRTTGDTALDDEILKRLQGKQFRSRVDLYRYDGSSWILIDDITGEISWSDSTKRQKYLNFGIQPISNEIEFTVQNINGKYSYGSGETEDGVLDLDTRIKLDATYLLEDEYLKDENDEVLTDENGVALSTGNREIKLYTSVFWLDDVRFNVNNTAIDTISCTGRDKYREAIEKDVFIGDLSSGVAIDALIKQVCDQIGISYSATSIVDLSSFGNRTLPGGLEDAKKADEIFEELMAIINKSGSSGYQMYMEYDETYNDNILYVQPLPSLYEADFAFTEREIIEIASFKRNRDRFLQRMTCFDKKRVPNEREQLASATYTTDGTKTLTLSKDSLFRSYDYTVNTGSPTVSLTSVSADELVFEVSNTGSVTITVYGTGFNTYPTYSGEFISHTNMVANIGQTAQIESLFFESDDECADVAKGFVEKFENPDKEARNLVYPYLNVFLQNNDMIFPFIRNFFEYDLYYIVGIKHSWSFQSESTSFDFQDSGLNWDDIYAGFIYDSDYVSPPSQGALQTYVAPVTLPLKYDIGLGYDMTYGPNAKQEDIPTTGFQKNLDFS